jgi:D-alanyl-D-alanine carboxypeptidase/D-alanyl-D-alanine carboxypeptidase (penicillin-binding protein 5/6)
MKKFRQIMIFALMCGLMMTMFSQSVTANAESCSAKSAIVIDAASGEVLYESNAYERLPMASTTKIMTSLIALESGNLDESFVVDSEAIKVEGSSMGLQEGDIVTQRALVCGMLLPSGNDAANATAVHIAGSVEKFVAMMNERAEELGLENTHFVTPSGLDDDTDEHYSTAYDMAVLTSYALQNEDFAEICSQRYIKLSYGNPPYERWLTNSNKLLDSCEGVIGVKTGFTDKAKRCLVSACERNGATLICVTLNDPNDWQDHASLYDYAFEKMRECTLPGSGEQYSLSVAGGENAQVTAESESVTMQLPINAESKIRSEVYIKPFVFAPVSEGEQVGSVKYYYGDKMLCEKPITLSESSSAKPVEVGRWKSMLKTIEEMLEVIQRSG